MKNKVYIVMAHYKHIGRQFMGTYLDKENAIKAKNKLMQSDRYTNVERWSIYVQFVQDYDG